MSESESYPFPSLRKRIVQVAAEGRHAEREAATWQLAEMTTEGPVGFNSHRRATERRVPRLRYPVVEAS